VLYLLPSGEIKIYVYNIARQTAAPQCRRRLC